MRRISRSAIVERSAAEMYSLVERIESYPHFLPWCVDARIRERTPGRTVATLTAGLRGFRQSFTTENLNVPERSIEMRLLEGPFRRFGGRWRFTPLGARASRIELQIEYQLAAGPLGRLLEPLLESMADTMVDAFTRRAHRGR